MDPFLFSTLVVSSAPLEDGQSWNSMGFPHAVVSVVYDKQDRLLVLDERGQLFRMSIGGRWERIFFLEEDQVDQEDLLLDAESTMGEMLEGIEVSETYYDADTQQTVVEEGQNTFDDEVQGGIFDPLRDEAKKERALSLHTTSNIILVCTPKCYESSGRAFQETNLPFVYDLVSMTIDAKSFTLAATEQGLWFRESMGTWKLANNSLRNFPFVDLEVMEGGVLAASPQGIFQSNNALFWTRKGTIKNVQRLALYNDMLFLSTGKHMYVSSDLGETTQKINHDIKGIHSFVVQQDMLWVVSYNSLFTLQGNQLIDQKRNAFDEGYSKLLLWREGVVLGGDKGLYLLSPEQEIMMVPMRHSLEDVLEMSLYDVDRQADRLSIQNPLIIGALSPVISLTGSLNRDLGIAVDYGGISSFAQERRAWVIGLDICFGRCGSIASTASDDVQEEELMVIDGSVYSQGGVAAAATGLELGIHKTRKSLFDKTIGLYQNHRQILMQKERSKTHPLSIEKAIFLELELEEVLALLNAQTQGRYETHD